MYCVCDISKSEIKLTMKRIEIIRRKRNAMQKFLRNDVADLLKNGLDSNAYDRVEQLYADQNLSWCYEFIEQKSCLLILSQLSVMNKQSECPEECKEAISTIMFAAARFADLPELRELRSLFSERYGNYLEPYVNKEFVKSLNADPPTKQIRLQMMHDIALEYGINWDSKALERKLYQQPPPVQDWSQYRNRRNNESLKIQHQNGLETNIQKEPDKKNKQTEIEKKEKSTIGNSLPYRSRGEIETRKVVKHEHDRVSPCWSSNTSSSSDSVTSADDSASEDIPQKFKIELTKRPTVSGNRQSDIPEGRKSIGLKSMGPPYIKSDSSKKTTGSNVNGDNLESEEKTEDSSKPIPRSMRVVRNNDVLKTRTKYTSSEISVGDYDCRDEEEKKMDKLLLHYSRKPSHVPAPKRSGSLPSESVTVGVVVDERKGITRAASYQVDPGSGQGGHVHPKLPDYDDFVARLAAFRASS